MAPRSFPTSLRSALAALALPALLACAGRTSASSGATAATDLPLTPLAPALHDARLPERIDDRTFWSMVQEFSEPGGYFRSENFVSNELGLQHVVSRLRTTMPPGGVYLGVGPEQNFTYLASLQPRIAFIVDIRRQNLLQHLWYKAVFELSPTRAEFLSRLFGRPLAGATSSDLPADSLIARLERTAPDSLYFRRTFDEARRLLVETHGFTLEPSELATLRYVDSVFYAMGPSLNYSSGASGNGYNFSRMPTFAQVASATDEQGANVGFLGSERSYRVVRDMQRRNLVIPLTGNFSGPHALRRVGTWLTERGARVGAFYVSNVEQYLFRQSDDWSRFYQNVGTLPIDSNSRFIRSTNTGPMVRTGPPYFMMQQLLSPIVPLVGAARDGTLNGYFDVIQRSN